MYEFSWQHNLNGHIPYTRGAQIASARLPGQQNFAPWRVVFVNPECVTLLAPRIWRWLLDVLKIGVTWLTVSSLLPLLLSMSVMGSICVSSIASALLITRQCHYFHSVQEWGAVKKVMNTERPCGLHDSCRLFQQIIKISNFVDRTPIVWMKPLTCTLL